MKYTSKKSEKENFEILSEELGKNIVVQNKKILDDDIVINNDDEETMYFVKTENDGYMKVEGKCKIDKKISRPNRNIKPVCHTNGEIKVLWGVDTDIGLDKKIFGGYIKATVILSSEENWMKRLEEVKQYIDENKKRPSCADKNKKIKKLGYFIQNSNKKYISCNMKNKIMYKNWEKFISKYKEYLLSFDEKWCSNYKILQQYINMNNNLPSPHTKEYNWCNQNRYKYAKKNVK
jgi:hypothetical protein